MNCGIKMVLGGISAKKGVICLKHVNTVILIEGAHCV